MFGFLRGPHNDAQYRRSYARCCRFQHQDYGLPSVPLLSYEAVFLYALASDAGLIARLPESEPTCCRLRIGRRLNEAADARVGRLCAAAGVYLIGVKLEDDIRDTRSWSARSARRILARPLEAATQTLASFDSEFPCRARSYIDRHLALERSSAAGLTLDAYIEPTADAFADLFRLLARATDLGRDDVGRRLGEIGWNVGGAIIAADCGADWARDRRTGNFNPLPDIHAVEAAQLAAQRFLVAAGYICQQISKGSAAAQRVLRAAFDRISGRSPRNPAPPTSRNRGSRLRRRAGFCDCDCPCDAGCCDGAGDSVCCFCDVVDCCSAPFDYCGERLWRMSSSSRASLADRPSAAARAAIFSASGRRQRSASGSGRLQPGGCPELKGSNRTTFRDGVRAIAGAPAVPEAGRAI